MAGRLILVAVGLAAKFTPVPTQFGVNIGKTREMIFIPPQNQRTETDYTYRGIEFNHI